LHIKFNIKVILLGGLALYAAQWVVSMVSGAVLGLVVGKLAPE